MADSELIELKNPLVGGSQTLVRGGLVVLSSVHESNSNVHIFRLHRAPICKLTLELSIEVSQCINMSLYIKTQ